MQIKNNIKFHFVLASLLRTLFLFYGYIQDNFFEVKFTDIDYHIFTDASQFVSNRSSPFDRTTYRYTPVLAFMLLPNVVIHNAFGKVLFCILDMFTSMLIYKILQNAKFSDKLCRQSTYMWLYNPMSIIIASRGNAESIMTTLIMITIYFLQTGYPIFSGLIYGLSVHFKIYPCIYALSFYFAFSFPNIYKSSWKKFKNLFFPNKNKCKFVVSSILGFMFPTLIFFKIYGEQYLNEALIYHIIRKDTRHNFSIYFYILYLLDTLNPNLSSFISLFAFFIQATLIVLFSWVFHTLSALPVCMFLQTFIFVTFNKVCTSQYFLWYLSLYPLIHPILKINYKDAISSFAIWLLGQALWLLPAYLLEFHSLNTFLFLFVSSILFFLINVIFTCKVIERSAHLFQVTDCKEK